MLIERKQPTRATKKQRGKGEREGAREIEREGSWWRGVKIADQIHVATMSSWRVIS